MSELSTLMLNGCNLIRELVDSLPDLIYIKDIESQFVFANIATVYSLGVTTLAEIVGKTDFDFHPRDLAERYYADEQTVLQSGEGLVNHEEPVVDQTGYRRWFLTTKFPIRGERDEVIGLMGTSHDITDRKLMEDRLRQELYRLQIVNAALERINGGG